MPQELKYKEEWSGEYRGVRYSVVKWNNADGVIWNYYLFIDVKQLPDDIKQMFNLRVKAFGHRKDYYSYDYMDAPIINDLDWHHGITYYEKLRDAKVIVYSYKLGCDYAHAWDEGYTYSVDYVASDAKHSIDRLWVLVPDLKVRSKHDGKYRHCVECEDKPDMCPKCMANKYSTKGTQESQ
jgi:hypothetical protein